MNILWTYTRVDNNFILVDIYVSCLLVSVWWLWWTVTRKLVRLLLATPHFLCFLGSWAHKALGCVHLLLLFLKVICRVHVFSGIITNEDVRGLMLGCSMSPFLSKRIIGQNLTIIKVHIYFCTQVIYKYRFWLIHLLCCQNDKIHMSLLEG